MCCAPPPPPKQVPYRDSKLTKLLIHSLGGNSRTMMISCISGASSAVLETLRTLHFSMSAARIQNRPVRFVDPVERLIMELRGEIQRLRQENRHLKSHLGTAPSSAAVSVKSISVLGGDDDGGGEDAKPTPNNSSSSSNSQSKLVSVCMVHDMYINMDFLWVYCIVIAVFPCMIIVIVACGSRDVFCRDNA
jgi:hypothetical protein